MSEKVEREPDLIEFKVNYTLDQDLPVENILWLKMLQRH
jgi:hypothetical protein